MIFMVYYVIKGKQKIKTASGDHVVETKWRRLGDIVKCTETFCAGPAGGHSANLEAQNYFFQGSWGFCTPTSCTPYTVNYFVHCTYELEKLYNVFIHNSQYI